jgi:hypothetical protein
MGVLVVAVAGSGKLIPVYHLPPYSLLKLIAFPLSLARFGFFVGIQM